MNYESVVELESEVRPGVRYQVSRMSFSRRLELMRRIQAKAAEAKFAAAAPDSPQDEADAALASAEIDLEYLRWGLAGVSGLSIDGEEATTEVLIERGPEELVSEALRLVLAATGLSEGERKNSESHSTSVKSRDPAGNATSVEEPGWSEGEVAVG